MTLQQLNYLADIAECGSINRAAKSLFVSQSSLSSALRELEMEIGISIFIRGNKGVEFTEEGRLFYERVQPILQQEKRVLDLYAGKGGEKTCRLRISTQHYPFAVQAFVKLLNRVEYNKCDFYLKETSLHTIIEDVSTGESDIGVLLVSNTTEQFIGRVLESRDLEFIPLTRVRPHAFLRRGHPLAEKAELTTKDLMNYPYVVFVKDRSVSYNFAEEVVLEDFDPPQNTIHVTDRATMYNILTNTDGFSMGSGLLSKGFADSRVCAVPLAGHADEIQLGWIRQKNRPLNQMADMYVGFLAECLGLEVAGSCQ